MTSFFLHRITLCPMENTLVRWTHRIHRTIWLCHNHQARRLHISLIELNPTCHDVICSPSDNSLSDGKHAFPMDPSDPSDNLTFKSLRLPQSPSTPLAHIPNWIKPCLSWRHFSPSDNSLFDGKHACPMDPSDPIWLSRGCHNHQAGHLHTSLVELYPTSHDVIFSPSDNSLSDGKHAVRWIHQIHRTIWLCHNHQARRLHTSLIELNPACHDVIFLHRITLCPMENTLVRCIHRIHRTIWLSWSWRTRFWHVRVFTFYLTGT